MVVRSTDASEGDGVRELSNYYYLRRSHCVDSSTTPLTSVMTTLFATPVATVCVIGSDRVNGTVYFRVSVSANSGCARSAPATLSCTAPPALVCICITGVACSSGSTFGVVGIPTDFTAVVHDWYTAR